MGESLPRIEADASRAEGNVIKITAETKNIESESELFAAGYNGRKITAFGKVQDGTVAIPAEGVKTIKIFCWDGLDTMRPLCEPESINIY